MLTRKHNKTRKTVKPIEKSKYFHLDDEEEPIAHRAKCELELCSFEEHFSSFAENNQTISEEDPFHLLKRIVTVPEVQSFRLKEEKMKVQSRYLTFKSQRHKKLEKVSIHAKTYCKSNLLNPTKNLSNNLQKSLHSISPLRQTFYYKSKSLNQTFHQKSFNNKNKILKRKWAKHHSVFSKQYNLTERNHKNSTLFSLTNGIQEYIQTHFKVERAKTERGEICNQKEPQLLRPQFFKLIKSMKKAQSGVKLRNKLKI